MDHFHLLAEIKKNIIDILPKNLLTSITKIIFFKFSFVIWIDY